MSRQKPKVQYSLDTGNIKELSDEEIRMILRGADELISTGGRSLLVKILKGSKDKKLLEYSDIKRLSWYLHNLLDFYVE